MARSIGWWWLWWCVACSGGTFDSASAGVDAAPDAQGGAGGSADAGAAGGDAGASSSSSSSSSTAHGGSSGSSGSSSSGPACGPATCAGCCDAVGECQPGVQNVSCGTNGDACANCAELDVCVDGPGATWCPGRPADANGIKVHACIQAACTFVYDSSVCCSSSGLACDSASLGCI